MTDWLIAIKERTVNIHSIEEEFYGKTSGISWDLAQPMRKDLEILIKEVERLRLQSQGPCEVCWTISWIPTEEGPRCDVCWQVEVFREMKKKQELDALSLKNLEENYDHMVKLLVKERAKMIALAEDIGYRVTAASLPYQERASEELKKENLIP